MDIKAAQPVVQSKSGGKKLIENQDKTEYAEILYVSPPNNTQASSTSPKTIPTTATIEDEIKNNKPKEIEIKWCFITDRYSLKNWAYGYAVFFHSKQGVSILL